MSLLRSLAEVGVYKAVYVAVHDGVDVAVFIARAGVLYERVGHEDVAANGAAEVYLHLHALDVAYLFKVLALLYLGELRAEHVLAVFKVLEVAALDLRGDDYARRDVRQAHGRGGLVDLLPARARGAVDVHLDILVAQLYLARVGYLRHDLDGGEARLSAARGVEGGYTHEPVHAVFALEEAVGVVAGYGDRRALDARAVPVEPVEQLDGVAVALAPARIHAVEHAGPVLRLRPARAGVEREDGVAGVVLAREQGRQPRRLELRLEVGQLLGQLRQNAGVVFLDGHLQQRGDVVELALQLFVGLAAGGQLFEPLLDGLRAGEVVPEALPGALGLELGDLGAGFVGLERAAHRLEHGRELVQAELYLVEFDDRIHVLPHFLSLEPPL